MRALKGFKAALAGITLPSAKRDSKKRTTKYTKQGPRLNASKGGKLRKK